MNTHVNQIVAGALCALALCGPAAPRVEAQRAANLTPETTVKLLLVDRLRSGTSRKGDRINFRVDEDVVDGAGNPLIRKGTPAYGTVTESRSAGTFGRRGRLNISIDYTTAIDGQRVPLRASHGAAGKSNAGISIAAFALVAPVAFFIKGSNAGLDPGAQVVAYVDAALAVGDGGTVGANAVGLPSAGSSPSATGPFTTLVLRNGDRISGRLASLVDGTYTIVTGSGVLKISSSSVSSMVTGGADSGSRVRTTMSTRPAQ